LFRRNCFDIFSLVQAIFSKNRISKLKIGGFPKSGLDKYIGKLVRAGHSVAVALQDEDKQRHIEEIIRVQVQQVNKVFIIKVMLPKLRPHQISP
jgi:DNA mismatch repair ATPase MutS